MGGKGLRAGAFLCAAIMLLSGCGGPRDVTGQENGTLVQDGAMGRYMEIFYEMPQEINRDGGVNWLDDGRGCHQEAEHPGTGGRRAGCAASGRTVRGDLYGEGDA